MCADRGLERVEQLVLIDAADGSQKLEVELAADHRGRAERREHAWIESADAAQDRLAHAPRQRGREDRTRRDRALSGAVQLSAVVERAQQLDHEQRVAVSLLAQHARQLLALLARRAR